VTADFPDWQAPQAHATAISVTGAPLLNLSSLVTSLVNKTVLANADIFTGPQQITQPGYEIRIQLGCPNGTAVPFGRVDIFWTDKSSGVQIGVDSYHIPAAGAAGQWTIYGRGPTKASVMNVTLSNLDAANSMTGTIYLIQNSRVYDTDDWFYSNADNAGLGVPGFTMPSLPVDNSVLGFEDNGLIGASSAVEFLCGMHNGAVQFAYEVNTGAAANLTVRLRPAPNSEYAAHNILGAQAAPPFTFQFAGPRAPVIVRLVNAATTGMNISWSLLRLDQ
jgi:hypothetical protein